MSYYKHGLAWHAMLSVLHGLLHNAYNVLVKYMNDHDLNSEDHPDFWVCTAIEQLAVYGCDELFERWNVLDAMQDYITEVWGISRYCYQTAGKAWSDDDLYKEIFVLWSREVGDADLYNFCCLPPNWSTAHINGRAPRTYETDGIILHHPKGVVE